MKPIIGILLRPMENQYGRKVDGMYESIRNVILEKGGIPLGLPFYHMEDLKEEEKEDLISLWNKCDGFLLQGGIDFYPIDLFLARYAYEKDIPLLGICLGMQTMAFLFNGQMVDLDNLSHMKKKEKYAHKIKIQKNSKLYQILKKEELMVNSRHQSVITETELSKVAYAEDGVIEAVEDEHKKFYIAVQWHPEDMISYDKVENLLIEAFIKACKE